MTAPSPAVRDSFWYVGVVLAALALVAHAALYDFISDDAFITLRYARNWIDGQGIVFNAGEYVEGYTSFLWLVALSGQGALGLDLLTAARAEGLACGLALVVLTGHWARRWHNGRRPMSLLAPLLVATNSSVAAYSLAGLETMLFSLLVLATLYAAWREEEVASSFPWSAGFGLLAALARPEGLAVVLVIGFFKARRMVQSRRDGSFRALAGWGAVIALGLGAHELWRLAYYGAPLPNTFYAKSGGGLAQAGRGLLYTYHFLLDHGSLFTIALAAAAWMDKPQRRAVRLLTAAVLALTLAVVLEGGDGLPMYRFFVPILAPLALLLQGGLAASTGVLSAGATGMRPSTASLVSGLAALGLVAVNADRPRLGAYYESYQYQQEVEVPAWTAVGQWLNAHAPPGSSFAAVPIGAVAYYSGLRAIDMLGLTDAHIARRTMPEMGRGWAGHEKHDGPYVLGRRSTFLLLGNINVTPQPAEGGIQYLNQNVFEREQDLLRQPEFRAQYRLQTVSLDSLGYLNFYLLAGTELR